MVSVPRRDPLRRHRLEHWWQRLPTHAPTPPCEPWRPALPSASARSTRRCTSTSATAIMRCPGSVVPLRRQRLLLMPSRHRRVRRMRFRKQGCARNEYGDDRGERKNLLHGIAPGSLKPVQYCARLRSAPATPRSSFRAAWLLTKVIVTVRDCSLKAAENQQSDQRDRHCTKRDCNKRECHVTHAL